MRNTVCRGSGKYKPLRRNAGPASGEGTAAFFRIAKNPVRAVVNMETPNL